MQEQLKQAETRDAERIGRIELRAGIGEIEIEEADLQIANRLVHSDLVILDELGYLRKRDFRCTLTPTR